MAIQISHDFMTLAVDGTVIATARFSQCAARRRQRRVDRLAPPALTLAERLAVGYGDDDPFVISWRKELFL